MRAVLEIARLRLLENVRRQVHLVTVFMAFAMLLLPAYINAFSMGLQAFEVVTKDFGLTLLSYYGVAMALLLGSTAIPGDVERRTIYPLLSRPLQRLGYLTGQLLGLSALLTLSLLLLAGALSLGIYSLSRHLDSGIFLATLGYAMESTVVLSACLCFSLFASPPLAGVMGFALYVVGGMSSAFIQFFLRDDRGAAHLARSVEVMQSFLPRLEVFRLKYPVTHGYQIAPEYHFAEFVYALGWVSFFLLCADFVFRRRDL